mmetsp:Transcript_42549/g.112275  ORF Transcript_42549/g.112275 Transcript_42549/m.112275 type:complete len:247 (-) Transcript_42549:269-1009(-)
MVLDPRMSQCLPSRETRRWVHLQQICDQVLGVHGNGLPILFNESELSPTYFLKHLGIGVAIERRVAAQQHEHNHAGTPQITSLIVFALQHLGCYVVWRACFGCEVLPSLKLASQTEIDLFQDVLGDGLSGVKKKVLWLHIAVTHLVFMHVVDGPDHLLHNNGCIRFCEVTRIDDAIKELSARAEFHHQVYISSVLKCLKQLYDARMIHHLHDGNFKPETLQIFHPGLGYGLDSSNLIRCLVFRLAN